MKPKHMPVHDRQDVNKKPVPVLPVAECAG